MAGTDFLLQLTTVNTRAQSVEQNKGAHERTSSTPAAQSFSSLYAQQRSSAANQQQQQRAAVQQDKQQQAARQSAAKQTAAAQAHKEKPVTPHKARNEIKAEQSKNVSSDAAEKPSSLSPEPAVASDGNTLPPETVEADDEMQNHLLDPLLLMALTTEPSEAEWTGHMFAGEAEEVASAEPVGLLLSSAEQDVEVELDTELLGKEDPLQQKNTLLLGEIAENQETPEADEAVVLNGGVFKDNLRSEEKITGDKNPLAVTAESTKAVPDALFNKAVAPADAIRADLQARAEPNLAAATVRQVPGPAVAMQQPGWSQQVTDKVMWMSSQNLQSAEIKLDPAELGRLDVKVSVNQEQTQITFTSAHAGVRDSLESQMFRLREMFAQQGMLNVDVNVADQSHAQQDSGERTTGQGRGSVDGDAGDESVQHVTAIREQHDGRLGMVDYYA